MATSIEVARLSPLTPRYGVEVHDVQLADIAPGNGYPLLRHLFDTHSLLLFRNQQISDSQHLALARMFGPIEDRKADERKPGEQPSVSPVTNVKEDGTLTGEMDMHTLHLKANMLWHIDSTFLPVPALTNILMARVVTSTGGQTEFASTRIAFADMNEDLKEKLRSSSFRHHYSASRAKISPELAALPMFHKWPEQRWKAVIRNPVTGMESIYIASHCFAIDDRSEADSRRFLKDTTDFCTQPRYVYSHNWRVGDVLIFDQRAVLHRGMPWPAHEPRHLSSVCVSLTDSDGLQDMRV
jgi:alpha-ketoglutarate-dependent 2,4-dichlorophenoxyacetate dioxygenase